MLGGKIQTYYIGRPLPEYLFQTNYPILKARKTSKYIYHSFLLGLHQVVVHEQPPHDHPVVAPVCALPVHLVPAPLPVVEAAIRPGVLPLSEPVSVYKLALVEIAVGKGVSAYPVFLPVPPLPVVNIAGLHSEGASALLLVSGPKALVVVAIIVPILALAFAQPVFPFSLELVMVCVFHVAWTRFFIIGPGTCVRSLGSNHFPCILSKIPCPCLSPFLTVPQQKVEDEYLKMAAPLGLSSANLPLKQAPLPQNIQPSPSFIPFLKQPTKRSPLLWITQAWPWRMPLSQLPWILTSPETTWQEPLPCQRSLSHSPSQTSRVVLQWQVPMPFLRLFLKKPWQRSPLGQCMVPWSGVEGLRQWPSKRSPPGKKRGCCMGCILIFQMAEAGADQFLGEEGGGAGGVGRGQELLEVFMTIQFLHPHWLDIKGMEKPSLEDAFLHHDYLELSELDQRNAGNSDMEGQPSPELDPLSSPNRRGGRRPNYSEKPARRRKKSEEHLQEQNHGHWLPEENKRYHWFLEIHYQHFVNSHMRRTDKIFKTMELFIGTRQAEQCRSHHQKMEKKYINFTNILIHFRQENYGTISPLPMRNELDSLTIDCPDGLANEIELDAYRKIEEDARKKYGRKRMWRRNLPEKHPTPTTLPPEPPSERQPITTGPSLESQAQEEEQAKEEPEEREERGEQPSHEINMFQESHRNAEQFHNNLDLSVHNIEDVSGLFNSFFNH